MLMDSFEVENFRSLKHLKLEKLARVNLLVGKNNSGKTSVLEALYALARIEMPEWFEDLESERGIDGEDHDFRALFYGFNSANRITVRAAYRQYTDGPREFGFWIEPLSEPNMRRRKGVKSLVVNIQVGSENTYSAVMTREERLGDTTYDPLTAEADDFWADELPYELAARHTAEFISTTIDLDLLSSHLSDLTINKEEEKLTDIIKQLDPRIKSLSLDSGGRVHFDLGESFSTLASINHAGEGVQRLLSVAAAIADNGGGTVLIDEIDNGLHYSALRILWKGIIQAAREYDVQVFATTHSAEALRHLTWVLDDEEYKDYRDDVAAYTLIRAKDDTVRSFRYNYEQLDFAMEHDMEVRN